MIVEDPVSIDEQDFPSLEAAAHALANALGDCLRDAVAVRGRALLALSGGRTPRRVLERLRKQRLDWSYVTITLVDERWVPPGHPDSNEGLVRARLMTGEAAAATFIPLYGGEDTPEAGGAACEERLRRLSLPFDAVYLGMGDDGHFASLFPGDPALHVNNRRSVAISSADGHRLRRMSLTAETILNARRVFLLFEGKRKQAAYENARLGGPVDDVPLRLVLRQEAVPVSVLRAP